MKNNNHSTSNSSPTYVELFAGCGGLSLGLHKAGWQGIFAIEKDPMAFETFRKNFLEKDSPYHSFSAWPLWLAKTNHSINDLLDKPLRTELVKLKGKVTMVAGGPPCQGFSVGGKRDGNDLRNSLVYSMLKIAFLIKPKIILIENVLGITKKFVSKPGVQNDFSVADDVVQKLSENGYNSDYFIIDSSEFGVPQIRKRALIVGILKESKIPESLINDFSQYLNTAALELKELLGLPLNKAVTAFQALDDLSVGSKIQCPDSPKFQSIKYSEAKSSYALAMRKGTKKNQVPNSHRLSKHGLAVTELYQSAHRSQPPGRLSKTFLLGKGTKKDKKELLNKNLPSSTITTHPDEFIHYRDPRNITVREMARLQSFPDNFHFFGRYTINGPRRKHDVARCSQVGNAVPPLAAEAIGRAISKIIEFSATNKETI